MPVDKALTHEMVSIQGMKSGNFVFCVNGVVYARKEPGLRTVFVIDNALKHGS